MTDVSALVVPGEDGCTCASTADVLRAQLEAVELSPCPVHVVETDPAGHPLAGMALNTAADTIAAALGMTTATNDGPLDAA